MPKGIYKRKSLEERFEEKYIPVTESGCWLWIACVDSFGYGILGINGTVEAAHRVSWKLYIGAIPKGIFVLHKCDVPACVNPNHLFLGTHQDNGADKKAKGRAARHIGEAHPMVILTEKDIKNIRKSISSRKDDANLYGVSVSQIGRIQNRTTWRHLK